MKYLKLSTFSLKNIDLKTFSYPGISFTAYNSRNGQNEIETVIKVESVHPWGVKPITLFYSSDYCPEKDEVQEETRVFNKNPRRYWNELFIPVLEKEQESLEQSIEENKKRLKKVKKNLEKLKTMEGH